ncbi:hypothetical protein M758_7G156600 [Ceratodon purpureus]|nr:hypothetical protein M758_7G156600 [Ceratodon purpureus]
MARALLFDMAARWWSEKTVAVVTGSNKGLGQAIARELARNGVTVVSTARDTARGLAAVDSAVKEEPQLKEFLHFHQLDVTADQSVAELASYLQDTFGGVDILINNAAMQKFQSEVYEDAVDTIETNYFGTTRVTEKLLPLLRASPFGARIVMVSSQVGQMENFEQNEYLKAKIQEALEHKDEKIVDAIARKYLEDVKAGREKEENWAKNLFQYRESKVFMNIYTRVLAAQLASRPEGHKIYVNAICPGAMKTDLLSSFKDKVGAAKAEELSATVRWTPIEKSATAVTSLALLPVNECLHGKFLARDLEGRPW